MSDGKIGVLIADDSKVSRMLLTHLLESDPRIRILAAVNDAQAAFDFLQTQKPDVIVMDFHMPGIDGLAATRHIMETQPVPIVICTSTANPRDVAFTFRILEAGAVACVEKPVGNEHPHFESRTAKLVQTVKLMSEVKVIRRWPRSRMAASKSKPAPVATLECGSGIARFRFVGIGASTGGPQVLQTILAGLPRDFSVPILIVQHIARGFLTGLGDWLSQSTGWKVNVAAQGVCPEPGHAYLAPDDLHMGISPSGHIALAKAEPEAGLRPAASYLFRSLTEVCGQNVIGVLLSGMGKDGAAELKAMKDRGAITIAQDRTTSIVHGMPGEAIALGGATHVLPSDRIADVLSGLARRM
jgi:two-component system chemotaxis response regulator CheB